MIVLEILLIDISFTNIKKNPLKIEGFLSLLTVSERPDLNWRPPDPQSGALPDYATSRKISLLVRQYLLKDQLNQF